MTAQRPHADDSIPVNTGKISHSDIYSVVSDFYTNVAKDSLLSVPFDDVEDWPHHIDLMTHFWWTRLGGARYLDYPYNPIAKHFAKGFNEKFLARWLQLFEESLLRHLPREQANEWLDLAKAIGAFLLKRNSDLIQVTKATS